MYKIVLLIALVTMDVSAGIKADSWFEENGYSQNEIRDYNDNQLILQDVGKENELNPLIVSDGKDNRKLLEASSAKQESRSNLWSIFFLAYFIIVIIAIFKGVGQKRTIIIFRDYNDLGLTFLIPAATYLVFLVFSPLSGNPMIGLVLAIGVALVLFWILMRRSYEDNGKSLLRTIMAVMTKIPLGFLWVLNFFTMLNPGGKTTIKRRRNRGDALVFLAILTPLIGILVANKEGSYFNPKEWIRGRRVGSIRENL